MWMFSLRARVLACLLMLAGSATAQQQATRTETPATPAALTKEVKDEVLAALAEVVTQRAFVPGVDLAKWPEFLEKQREALDKAERDTDFSRAVNAALRDFGISHIRFNAPRVAENRRRTSVIGVGVTARPDNGALRVTYVYKDAPADKAGIKVGELISLIDGKAPEGAAALLGDEGSEVKLTVKGQDEKEREVVLKRAAHSTARADTLTWVGEDAAILKIHSFQRGYRMDAIDQLMGEAAKAKFLIVDLRSNGGGSTANLQHLLSHFLPANSVIGTFINRQLAQEFEKLNGRAESDPLVLAKAATRNYRTRALPQGQFKGKVAVLINRGSASASEICASALREHLAATVVGSRTAGAVLASVFRSLPHGYELQYPVSDYVSFKGVRLEKNPVVPDIEVTEPVADGKDPVVEAALSKLRSQ
ncbi:MAG TPA: S41 family peptidase [Fimbriimonadaceae bacterium]|nr:S41 family peptidase [Fimbriimonadaceae bacterium]